MFLKPPITNLLIRVSHSGFYRGFSKDVTISEKILVGALILWAIIKGVVVIFIDQFLYRGLRAWVRYN